MDNDYMDWHDLTKTHVPVPVLPFKEYLKTFRQEIIHTYQIELAWVVYKSKKLIHMVKKARNQFDTCLPQYELWNSRLCMILYPGLHVENGMIVLDSLEGSVNHVEVDICKIETCKRMVDIYAYLDCVYQYMRYRAYRPSVDRETLQNVDLDDLIYDEFKQFYIT